MTDFAASLASEGLQPGSDHIVEELYAAGQLLAGVALLALMEPTLPDQGRERGNVLRQ